MGCICLAHSSFFLVLLREALFSVGNLFLMGGRGWPHKLSHHQDGNVTLICSKSSLFSLPIVISLRRACDLRCLISIWPEIFSRTLGRKFSLRDYACVLNSLQSCLTLCTSGDCNPPGLFVRGVLQARMLDWVAIPFSRGLSWPRDQTHVSYVSGIGRQLLYHQFHLYDHSWCKPMM